MRPENINPVWMLFQRRISSQIAYWLSVLGYNVHDHSTTNRIYLFYFCGFWLVWILAMFFLLGYTVAGNLNGFKGTSLFQLSVLSYNYALMMWVVINLWRVTRRSPFSFSEEDAYLLCRTPVSRREVGLISFFLGWGQTFIFFGAAAIIIAFALVESNPHPGLILLRMVGYFGAGLRALGIILPLHMGLQAALWGIGAWRLKCKPGQHKQIQSGLRMTAPVLLLLLIISLLIPGLNSALLSPLILPLQAAFGGGIAELSWPEGFGLSLLYLTAGFLLLLFFVNKINLSRAAEETRLFTAVQEARSFWSFDLADALIQRQRLAATASPARLPARSGSWMLVWKDAVQSMRSLRLGLIINWALVIGWGLGMFIGPNWGVQMLACGFWAIKMGDLATQRLRNDLARWWLLRSLPIRSSNVVKAEIGLSTLVGTFLSWMALAISNKPFPLYLFAGALLIFMTVNSALASAHDILRRSEARILLSPSIAEENVPHQSIEGIIRTVLTTLIPFGGLIWFFAHPDQIMVGGIALMIAATITMFKLRTVPAAFRWIE